MNWKFWVGTAISALFLYLAFHNIDLHLIYHSMQSTSIPLIITVGFLTVILYLIRALRWFHLLAPIKKIGLDSLFSSTVIGFAANCVLPARLGEFIRANYIGTFHVACQYGLIFYGFSRPNALSMAIILRAAGFIPTVLLGLLVFSLHHISFRSLRSGMGNRATG